MVKLLCVFLPQFFFCFLSHALTLLSSLCFLAFLLTIWICSSCCLISWLDLMLPHVWSRHLFLNSCSTAWFPRCQSNASLFDYSFHFVMWLRCFAVSSLKADISSFVVACNTCTRFNHVNRAPAGFLRPLPISYRPWSDITLHHMTTHPQWPHLYYDSGSFLESQSLHPRSKTSICQGDLWTHG